jgi:hypothetical protein
MSAAVDARSVSAAFAGGSTQSWTHTPSGTPSYVRVTFSGALLISSWGGFTTVTYGGNAMTLAKDSVGSDGTYYYYAAIYELLAPTSGAQTVVVSGSGGTIYGECAAATFTGTHATTPTGNTDSSAAVVGTGTQSLTISSASGNYVTDAAVTSGILAGLTPLGGQSLELSGHDTLVGLWGSDLAGASSTVMSWNVSSGGVIYVQAAAEVVAGLGSPGTTHYHPLSDVSSGTWTPSSGGSLFAMLDESVADDGDYIISALNPTADTAEISFGTVGNDGTTSGRVIRYRIKGDASTPITVNLRQGSTTVKQWVHSPAPSSLTTFTQTLSSGEAATIDYAQALKLQVIAN